MVRDVATAPECLSKLNEMRVYAFNGNATDNFQVYHNDVVGLAETARRLHTDDPTRDRRPDVPDPVALSVVAQSPVHLPARR